MSANQTNSIEYLVLDGPLGLSLAVTLGLALILLCGWSLWRERQVLGGRTMLLFWILRTTAVTTVVWMLLAPTQVRVDTSTTRRAIAIVTDVSGSMRTADLPGGADDLRWSLADASNESIAALRSIDRAIAAVGMAQRGLQRAADALQQLEPEKAVLESATAADAAIERATTHLGEVRERETNSEARVAKLCNQAGQILDGPEFQAFRRLTQDLEAGRLPAQQGWRESLPDLEHRLDTVRRTLNELSRLVVARMVVESAAPADGTSPAGSPRLTRAAQFLERLEASTLPALREKADVQLSVFDQSVSQLSEGSSPATFLATSLAKEAATTDPAPTNSLGTNVTAVLEQLQQWQHEQPLAAVFLISDMAHNQNDETAPREVAEMLDGTPVFVIPIGNSRQMRDVLLQDVYAPTIAMRNDAVVIEVSLQAYDCEGEVCIVQLLQDGEVVDFREVDLDSAFVSRTVRFERSLPATGEQKFQVAIPPLKDELTESNNYDEFAVQVTRSDIKVLLADEMPRWEYRYLSQLFRRDPKVECDELLFHPRMVATGRREESTTLPTTVEQWNQYDVVLLGDLPPEHFPAASQESLVQYLERRGGTLVLIAGQQFMPQGYVDHPLEEVLPVGPAESAGTDESAGFAFRVTSDGWAQRALMIGESEPETRAAWDFVNRFSPLWQVSNWRNPRPSARSLIDAIPRGAVADTHQPGTFLCWQPIGRGRVVYLSAPETFRLRMLRGDRFHYRFWGQLLRWSIASELSAGNKFVRVRTDKSRYNPRDTVQATVRLTDVDGNPVAAPALEARITAPDLDRTVPLEPAADRPGEYHATIPALPPGNYRITPVGEVVDELSGNDDPQEPASTSFTVLADQPLELVDTRCDRVLAQQIADSTGGLVVPPTAVDEILKLTNLDPVVTERRERQPQWLRWEFLWLVLGCLHVEWITRKWRGLS